MKSTPDGSGRWLLLALVILTAGIQGCASVQVTSRNGQPKLVGLGWVKSIESGNGKVYHIVAPGISLRIQSYAPGLSLGCHETRVFFPGKASAQDTNAQPIAVERKCVGLDLAPYHLMLGYDRSFGITAPPSGKSVVQLISYSASDPSKTIVEQKEIK
jgi:hypothetical protein